MMHERRTQKRLSSAVQFIGLVATIAGYAGAQPHEKSPETPLLTITATIDLGKDRGQNIGSLFEVKDEAGRVIAGAGFPSVYNTRFRMDRHAIQFFASPPERSSEFRLQRIPRPDDHCGLYMFDFGGRLYAINEAAGGPFQAWEPSAGSWIPAAGPVEGLQSSNDGVVRVGAGTLRFSNGSVMYDGRTILRAPDAGRFANFYYARGRLFFYHTEGSGTDGSTRICACRWTPDDPDVVDINDADVITIEPVGATTWAYGHLGDQIITVSNHGGVYVHDGSAWRILRDRVPNVSYQVYSVLTYYDRLLLGHYPTGEIFEFDGSKLTRRERFPPKLPSVSASARECQTLALYRGELFAGVWPWGELWRFDRHADAWTSLGRLFTHPAPTNRTVHPYEADSLRHGLVLNHWGQRVTSAVLTGSSLMLSTSAKGNILWDPKFGDFLSEDARKEYGAVLQLDMPGSLSMPILWRSKPTEFQFTICADRMSVLQDGMELGSTAVDHEFLEGLQPASIDWGRGVFGSLDGVLTMSNVGGSTWPVDSD